MNPLRHSLTEAAVLGDSLAWKLRGCGLFAVGGLDAVGAAWTMPDWVKELGRSQRSAPRAAPIKLVRRLRLGRSVAFWGAGLAALAAGAGAAAVAARAETQRLLDLRERLGIVVVESADGFALGGLPRPDRIVGLDGSKAEVVRVTTPVAALPLDFLWSAKAIEGEGLLGLSPHNMVRSATCYAAAGVGLANADWLRLNKGRCAGASTLLAQSVRSLTNDRQVTMRRKLREIGSTVALSLTLSDERRDRLVADSLYFGDAEGQPIIGVENAARVVFGRSAEQLELHQSAYLSALLLIPARLSCTATTSSDARFKDQVERASGALGKAFAHDPRLADALAKLAAMAPIAAPASDQLALAAGRSPGEACRAGAGPLLRFEVLDSSARLAVRAELAASLAPRTADKVVLTYRWADQATFKADIDRARGEIAAGQAGQWLSDPRGPGVVTLAFTTDPRGALTGLYESSATPQLYRSHELGSLAKLAALAFLAKRGWDERHFCNRQARLGGVQLHNAGGDIGVAECAPGTGLDAAEVWGRSLSLAVYDALRGYSDTDLRSQMAAWRIELPAGSDAAYALAFGLARATPADFAAFLAALSAGNLGQPALGYRAHLLRTDGPAVTAIDLSDIFAQPGAAALIARAGGAAQTWHGPHALGTLTGLGTAIPGALAKSGTLDDDVGQVRYKAAAGGLGGATWTVMVFPANGALGSDAISIIPLAKAVSWRASSSNVR